MVFFAYYGAAIGIAYYVGRRSTAGGIAVFFVAVALHQLVESGPSSFLEPSGCDYGVRASDC